jgi:hypothetical protein
MMSGGLVKVEAIPIMIPLIAALTLNAVSVLMMVPNPSACILDTKNIPQVFFAPTMVALQPRG